MSRLLLTAAVLAVLIYTMVLGVRWLTPRIEQDIANRVTTSLAEQGLLWADVSVQGRSVTLSGEAPTIESKERAIQAASKVFGVAKVEDQLSIAEETETAAQTKPSRKGKTQAPYTLTITKEGDKVILSGTVGSEADKAVLLRLAGTHYGPENVQADELVITEGAPAGWRTAAGTVLFNIFNMEQASATFSNNEVMVSGTVIDQQFSDQVENAVKTTLPENYKVAFAVEVVTPTVASTPVKTEENAEMAIEPAAEEASATTVAETPAATPAKEPATETKTAGKEATPAPTTHPTVANTTGCAGMDEVKKERLLFDFDKAQLKQEHAPILQRVAGKLQSCTTEKLVVAGYTDQTGSALYNKWLSQQRAEAAMRGLMRDGIAKSRLKTVGYGEKFPEAANTTKEGRAANRRVEFYPGTQLPHVVAPAGKPAAKAAPATTTSRPTTEIEKPWWAKTGVTTTPEGSAAPAATAEVSSTEKPWLGETH